MLAVNFRREEGKKRKKNRAANGRGGEGEGGKKKRKEPSFTTRHRGPPTRMKKNEYPGLPASALGLNQKGVKKKVYPAGAFSSCPARDEG